MTRAQKTPILGSYVNSLTYSQENGEIQTVSGYVCGFFLDPHGRQFVQLKTKQGNAINVDRFTVNATTEDRQKYLDVMQEVNEIQKNGNKEIEDFQKAMTENCNGKINALFGSLTPLIELPEADLPEEGETPIEALEAKAEENQETLQ